MEPHRSQTLLGLWYQRPERKTMQRKVTALLYRYISHIDTSQSKYNWTLDDEQKLIELHNELGNKWAIIGQQIGGR